MKKTIFIFLTILILIITIIGCSNNDSEDISNKNKNSGTEEKNTLSISGAFISLSGDTLNDGFTIQNSDIIIFGFERILDSSDSEITITVPSGINTFSVTKDGTGCPVNGMSDCSGSFVIVPLSSPGSFMIIDTGETPGTALFITTIEAQASVPILSCDWQINPSTNTDMQFVRGIPDINITYPIEVSSGDSGIILDASTSVPSYVGTITPTPLITSYSWTQTGGPAVTLNDETTSTLTFDAPAVGVDTDFTFGLTVTDDIGLTSIATVTVTVQAL